MASSKLNFDVLGSWKKCKFKIANIGKLMSYTQSAKKSKVAAFRNCQFCQRKISLVAVNFNNKMLHIFTVLYFKILKKLAMYKHAWQRLFSKLVVVKIVTLKYQTNSLYWHLPYLTILNVTKTSKSSNFFTINNIKY